MANCSCHRVLHSSRPTTALWQRGGHRYQRRVEPMQPVVVGTQGLTHQAAVAAVAAVAVVVLAAVVAEAVSAAGAVVVFKQGQPQPAAQAWLVLDVPWPVAPGDCMLMLMMMLMMMMMMVLLLLPQGWHKPRLWQLSPASRLHLQC